MRHMPSSKHSSKLAGATSWLMESVAQGRARRLISRRTQGGKARTGAGRTTELPRPSLQ
jgi:hypothetical protein